MMKLAALKLALAAAALAAPRAGTKRGPGTDTHTINEIRYTSGPTDSTQVCLTEDILDGVDAAKIRLTVSMDGTQATYFATGPPTKKCATFGAVMPTTDVHISYALGVTDTNSNGEDTVLDMRAGVAFDFMEIKPQTQITCNERFFKKTDSDIEEVDGPIDGCNTAETTGDPVKYCLEGQEPTVLAQKEDGSTPVELTAESLAYTNVLTLGAVDDDNTLVDKLSVIVVTEDDKKEAIFPELSVDGTKATVALEDFERGTSTYTACPVVEDFTAYSITDMYIIGTLDNVNGGDKYYQFGFRYDKQKPPKYQASITATSDESPSDVVTLDCSYLDGSLDDDTTSTRCYGFLKGGTGSLTVSYFDDSGSEITNSIIVKSDNLKDPAQTPVPDPED